VTDNKGVRRRKKNPNPQEGGVDLEKFQSQFRERNKVRDDFLGVVQHELNHGGLNELAEEVQQTAHIRTNNFLCRQKIEEKEKQTDETRSKRREERKKREHTTRVLNLGQVLTAFVLSS
jgi:hypothetical protein